MTILLHSNSYFVKIGHEGEGGSKILKKINTWFMNDSESERGGGESQDCRGGRGLLCCHDK